MYVANQGNRTYNQPMQSKNKHVGTGDLNRKPYQQQARKLECFRCGGDHFVQDFPYEKPPLNQAVGIAQQFSTVPQYCKDCAIEHLSKDCPDKPVVTIAQVGKNRVEPW